MCQCQLWLFKISLVSCVLLVAAFNVDEYNHAFFRGNQQSMFGFSVAIHKSRNQGWLLVGAPEDQSRYQTALNRSGVVYKCDITREDIPCTEVPFDNNRGNNVGTDRTEIDDKSGQWFGATLSATGTEEGRVVACAPRYVWFTEKRNRKDPVGTCWVADGLFREFNEYSPCRARNRWGYHRQGSCQAGFSAALDSKGDLLFMGAPGSWYWQGQAFSIDANEHFPYTPGMFSTFGSPSRFFNQGGAHSQNTIRRTVVYSTPSGSPADDDSYMGYSMTVGKFFHGDEKQGVAVGMPRGNRLKGKVLLFRWDMTNFKNFTGDQIGSYYGYALATADVDGDGRDDLIIGAPMYTPENAKDKYDVGRVYVIYQKDNFVYHEENRQIIDGFQSKSRFGQAVASLKDINLDGYEDFAVGAPYGGPDMKNEQGQGAVYIYHGSAEGVRKNYSQVIFGKDVEIIHGYPKNTFNTFGFSISGGMDLDGNGYPDMAVGAYESNSAFLFRSRPVVKIDAAVEYLHESKQVDINQKNCINELNNEQVICTSFNFCLRYSGIGIEDTLTFVLKYTVDAKKQYNPRMAFKGSDSNTFSDRVTMRKEEEQCFTYETYIKNDFTDKLTPLDVEVDYNLENADLPQALPLTRNPNIPRLKPIIDHDLPLSRKDSLIIFKNCPDNKCIPNLQVEASSTAASYLLGSPEDLKIGIYVRNFGQDSFETTLEVRHPEAFQYVGKDDITVSTPVRCSPFNRTITKCDIGNPLPAEKVADFYMRFSEQRDATISDMLDFEFIVNSTNPEENNTLGDNHAYLTVSVMVNANLDILGESYPKDLEYNAMETLPEKIENAADIGPPVTYVYYLTNLGPSPVYESEVFFVWPYETLEGDDLLYLTQPPQVLGNAQCDKVPVDKNNYHFSEFRPKNEFERLNITGLNIAQEHHVAVINRTDGSFVESGMGFKGVPGGTFVNYTNVENGEATGDSSFDVLRRQHNYSESETKKREDFFEEYTYVTRVVRDPVLGDVPIVTMYNHLGIIDEFRVETGNSFTEDTGSQTYVGSRKKIKGGGSLSVQEGEYVPGTKKFTETTVKQWSSSSGVSGTYGEGGQQFASSGSSHYNQEGQYGTSGSKQFTTTYYSRGSQQASGEKQGVFSTYHKRPVQTQGSIHHSVHTTHHQGGSTSASQGSVGQQGTFGTYHREGSIYSHHGSGGASQNQQGGFSTYHRETASSGYQGGGVRGQGAGFNTYNGQTSQQGSVEGGSRGYGYTKTKTQVLPTIVTRGKVSEQVSKTSHINPDGGTTITETKTKITPITITGGNVTRTIISTGDVYRTRDGNLERIGGGGYTEGASSSSGSNYYQENSSSGGHRYQQTGTGGSIYNDRRRVDLASSLNNMIRVPEGSFKNTAIEIDPGFQIHVTEGAISEYEQNYDDYGRIDDHGRRSTGSHSIGASSRGHFYKSGHESRSSVTDSNGKRQKWHEDSQWSRSGSIPPTYEHNSVERDNVPTDEPGFANHRRGKRQLARMTDKPENVYRRINEDLPCKSSRCFYMRCVVGEMEQSEQVVFALVGRINQNTLRKISINQPITLSTMMSARITRLPYVDRHIKRELRIAEVNTTILPPSPELKPEVVPLWIVVLSAVAGTLILLLLILLLYKLGFFKRNRPSSAPERQPLNRNGYHHGDEAL